MKLSGHILFFAKYYFRLDKNGREEEMAVKKKCPRFALNYTQNGCEIDLRTINNNWNLTFEPTNSR